MGQAGLATVFFLTSLVSLAQTTGVLSGRVLDATAVPLSDAAVQAILSDTVFITASATDGEFRFETLPTGIYRVRVTHIGHLPAEQAEVWVRSGKEQQLEFTLLTNTVELRPVEVRTGAVERLNAVSSIALTVEKSLRYPATFSDPARLAMSYPGVVATNDQGDHFSVRGNNPGNNVWLLEGVEIVTPSHLTNAGTETDLPSLTGGGTTILSAQMLGNSQLLTGGLSAPYGNALGGVMDLRLRGGLTKRRAYTVQAGLIGIDLSAEGPFKQGGKASYLVNYRYSTLGLLGSMNVALGDEAISFQDIAFTVNLPFSDRSELLLFGMGGNSSNRFEAKDSTEWEFEKDDRTIDYEAQVGAAGLAFQQRIGSHAQWNTTVALSQNEQERRLHIAPYRQVLDFRDTVFLGEKKRAARTRFMMSVGAKGRLEAGVHAMERSVEKRYTILHERNASWLIRPYVRYQHDFGENVDVDLGVGYTKWTTHDTGVVEPRLAIGHRVGERGRLVVAAGIRSQMPLVQNYVLRYAAPGLQFDIVTDNRTLGPMRSYDAELRYSHRFQPYLAGHITVFGQQQMDVPVIVPAYFVSAWPGHTMVNAWNELSVLQLSGSGEARSLGGELALERTFFRDLFYQVNATYFSSTCTDMAGVRIPSRWNNRYIANAVLGREFVKQKENAKRTWGVNGRFSMAGGQTFSYVPIDWDVDSDQRYYKDVMRLDLRVYLKRERQGRTGMWALDLLNATNAKNEAYRYFDSRKGTQVTKYQLGLIPNLSYRIEF